MCLRKLILTRVGIFTHCLISFLNLTIYQSSRWRRTRAWGERTYDAIYQTSRRQYVTANPTLTYISLTSTTYTYRHFNRTNFILRGSGNLSSRRHLHRVEGGHGGTFYGPSFLILYTPVDILIAHRRHLVLGGLSPTY